VKKLENIVLILLREKETTGKWLYNNISNSNYKSIIYSWYDVTWHITIAIVYVTTDRKKWCEVQLLWGMYCHVYVCLQMGFGLVTGFIEHLQIVTTTIAVSLIRTLSRSIQHVLSLLSLLQLHQLFSVKAPNAVDTSTSVFTSLLASNYLTTDRTLDLSCL
jgi:hypothetical protein